MRAIAKLGEKVRVQWDELRHAAAVIGTVLSLCVQPRSWARTVRNLFARQVLAVGVEPVGFVCVVAAFVGISVVAQLAFWTGEAGQSQLLGPLLVAVVARELGPLLTNIVVIVRSSSEMDRTVGNARGRAEFCKAALHARVDTRLLFEPRADPPGPVLPSWQRN